MVKCLNLKTGSQRNYSGTPNNLPSFHKIFKEKTATGFENNEMVYLQLTFDSADVVLEDALPYNKAKHFWANHTDVLNDCETYE